MKIKVICPFCHVVLTIMLYTRTIEEIETALDNLICPFCKTHLNMESLIPAGGEQ